MSSVDLHTPPAQSGAPHPTSPAQPEPEATSSTHEGQGSPLGAHREESPMTSPSRPPAESSDALPINPQRADAPQNGGLLSDERSEPGAQLEVSHLSDSLLPPEGGAHEALTPYPSTPPGQAHTSGELEGQDRAYQEEATSTLAPLLGAPTAPNLGVDGADQVTPAISLSPTPEQPDQDPLDRPRENDSGSDWLLTPQPHVTTTNPLTSTTSPLVQSLTQPGQEGDLESQPPLSPSAPPSEGYAEDSAPPDTAEPLITLTLNEDLRPLAPRKLQRLEAFINTLERARGAHVLIVIKGHPDPDSIGSAVAQQHCFNRFDITSTVLYFDEISHPENRALVKVIEMDLSLYDEEFDFTAFDYLAFIDSQSADIPQAIGVELPPILTFVDHHKDTGKVEAEFVDIRETYGSTSAIYAEYLEYYPDFSLQKSSSSDAHLATALMHGIRTDTDNLTLGSSHDFYAAGYLRNFIDRDLLRMVSKQSVSARTMEIIKQGLNNKVIKGTFLLAGVGFVREEDRDGIAQTADFLLRHEGVETAVGFGIVNNNIVDGSLRTSSATVDPDRWLKELFGQDDHGKPYGGGRRNKGGFRIPLGLLAFSPDRRALWKLGEQTIHDLIFEKIGGKEDDAKEA